jgi:hypothetical protein
LLVICVGSIGFDIESRHGDRSLFR